MLTEAEAATKRCPMSFGPTPAQAPAFSTTLSGNPFSHGWNSNGVGYVPSPLNCIGSGCMAWRWNGDSPAFPGAGPEDSLDFNSRKGSCGLAR